MTRYVAIALALTSALGAGCKSNAKKPILYLYPEEVTDVTVRFAEPDSVELTSTWPEYGTDGWSVTAHPDGTLVDAATEEEFYALYWEGLASPPGRLDTGAVVAGDDTAEFLDDSLEQLGLTPRERNEFVITQQNVEANEAILELNRHNFIHFSTDEWDAQVPLDIDPAPDSLVRVMMYWRPCAGNMKVEPQELVTPAREGFTVVEWGGTRLRR